MSETQATHLTRCREVLDESAARYWSDTELRRWINDAALDISRKAEVLQKKDSTTNVIAGTAEYTVPTNTLRIFRVEYVRDNDSQVFPLEFRPYNQMDSIWYTHQDITQSIPQFYTLWGFPPNMYARLFPVPANDGTLNIFYYRSPTKLTVTSAADAAQAVEIPDGWEDLISAYVEYMALRKDADPRWQEAKAIYDEKLDSMYRLTREFSDQMTYMTSDVSGAYVPAWLWSEGYDY